jgi:hypothetical protein
LSNKEGHVYLNETTGDWKADNATLVEISGEDGTDGRLVNVNGGEWSDIVRLKGSILWE